MHVAFLLWQILNGKSLSFMCELRVDLAWRNLAKKGSWLLGKKTTILLGMAMFGTWYMNGSISDKTKDRSARMFVRRKKWEIYHMQERSMVRGSKGGIQEATYHLFMVGNNSVNTSTWCVDSAHIIWFVFFFKLIFLI